MRAENLIDAIGEIRDDLIRDAEEASSRKTGRRRKFFRTLLVAAILVAMLTGVAVAEMDSGAVSNLLAPLFGGVRAELVGDIGRPVGASVSAGGYTLTADAIIGDRYNVAVVYTFTRDDGQPIPEGTDFMEWEDNLLSGGGGGTRRIVRSEEEPHKIQLVEQMTRSYGGLIGRMARVSLSDFAIMGFDWGDEEILAHGPWELSFALRYKDTTRKIPVKDLTVKDAIGQEHQVRKILLSNVGVHMEVVAPAPDWEDVGSLMREFHVSVRTTDGETIQLWGDSGGSGSKGRKTVDAHYGAEFPVPIPMEEIEALIICDTTLPLKGE